MNLILKKKKKLKLTYLSKPSKLFLHKLTILNKLNNKKKLNLVGQLQIVFLLI